MYRGLGTSYLITYGITEVKINFRNRCEKIILHIVSNTAVSIPLILGRDSINKINIHLCLKLIKNTFLNKCHENLYVQLIQTREMNLKVKQLLLMMRTNYLWTVLVVTYKILMIFNESAKNNLGEDYRIKLKLTVMLL